MATATATDGRSVTYYGTKDRTGLATSVSDAVIQTADGQVRVDYDRSDNPATISHGGTSITLSWSGDSVTATTVLSDGTVVSSGETTGVTDVPSYGPAITREQFCSAVGDLAKKLCRKSATLTTAIVTLCTRAKVLAGVCAVILRGLAIMGCDFAAEQVCLVELSLESYTVRGKVTDENGAPIKDARVSLGGRAGMTPTITSTGPDGTYSTRPAENEEGEYTLLVEAKGFIGSAVKVTLPGPVTRDFKLKEIVTTTTYTGPYTGTHTLTFGSPTPVCFRRHAVTGTLTITLTVRESTGKTSGTGKVLQNDVVVALDCPTGPQMGEKNNLEMNPIKVAIEGNRVTFDQSQSNNFGGSDGGGVRTERLRFDGTLTSGRIQGTLTEIITTTTTGNGSGSYAVTLK